MAIDVDPGSAAVAAEQGDVGSRRSVDDQEHRDGDPDEQTGQRAQHQHA